MVGTGSIKFKMWLIFMRTNLSINNCGQNRNYIVQKKWSFVLKPFLKKILLLFNYSCMPFLPIPPPHPSQTHFPPAWFCPCVLYSSSCNPLSSWSPHHSPLTIVTWFLTSMSLVIFCFLFSSIDYVPVKEVKNVAQGNS